MSLIAACVAPHPPVILPEVGGALRARVAATVSGMERLGEEVATLAPDVLVLISPHAGLERGRMGVNVSGRYQGSMAAFGAPEVAFDLEGDITLAESLLRECLSRQLPVMPRGSAERVHELDHGAQVPLYFLLGRTRRLPRLLLLTFSLLGIEEHLEFGRAVGAAVEVSPQRILFVASGDLSHRLTPDAPAGYEPRGQEFDDAVREAFERADAVTLTHLPQGLVEAAGECGYRSLLALFGVLEGRAYDTRLLSYEGPFGVGYLVGLVDLSGVGGPPTDGGSAQGGGP
jgi:MEMO1 family protein